MNDFFEDVRVFGNHVGEVVLVVVNNYLITTVLERLALRLDIFLNMDLVVRRAIAEHPSSRMIEKVRFHINSGCVLLCGIRAMRNYGRAYAEELAAVYTGLAQKYDAPLDPSFLDGVTGVPGMTLPDGLHPTAQGVAAIVTRILPTAETFVTRLGTARASTP